MKKYFIIIFLSISLIGQSQINTDSLTKDIRQKYSKIQSNLESCVKKHYISKYPNSEPEEIKYTAYYKPTGSLVKISADCKYLNSNKKLEYFIDNSDLFFLFNVETMNDGTQVQERIYFYGDSIFKALIKEKKPDDKRSFGKIPNQKHTNISSTDYYSYHSDALVKRYLKYPVFEICNDVNLKIKRIKAEYNGIETKRKNSQLIEKEVYYENVKAHWWNTDFTAYYNEKSELVLLEFFFSDEGHSSKYSVYMKTYKPFFIFHERSEPHGEEYNDYIHYEERFYIYNDKVIRSLKKTKTEKDKSVFSEIKNVDQLANVDDIEEYSIKTIRGLELEFWQFFSAVDK